MTEKDQKSNLTYYFYLDYMSHGTSADASKSANLLRSKSLTDDQVQVRIKNWKDDCIQ